MTLSQEEHIQACERRRIASDLHDDLGAKLLTIVHSKDIRRMAELAREALDDMRLIVGHLGGEATHLPDAAADWRAEFVGRLDDAGIAAHWDDIGSGSSCWLSARIYMQLTRILREAVSNVVKHSHAVNCRVRCGASPSGLFVLEVADDGRGIPANARAGHGLTGMQARAADARGICVIEDGPVGGVVVRVSMHLHAVPI